jgi:hypothetical protein
MADVDDRPRTELAHQVEPIPTTDVLAQVAHRRRRRRQRRRVALSGVAAVVVLAAGVASALVLRDGDSADVATQEGKQDPTSGWRPVSFHGVELRVPRAWPIGAIECGVPMRDTVIIDVSMVSACLGPRPEEPVTVVWVDSIGSGLRGAAAALAHDEVTVDGYPARRGSGVLPEWDIEVDVLVVPARDVVITVESPDDALAAQILGTVRVREVNDNGCPARSEPRDSPPPPTVPGSEATLVPGAPTRVLECRYESGLLEGSAPPRSGEQLAGLVSLLNGLPAGTVESPAGWDGSCPPGQDGCELSKPRSFVLRFEYADGETLTVDVRIAGPGDLRATNGSRSSRPTPDLVFHLADRLGYDAGFPDPRSYG